MVFSKSTEVSSLIISRISPEIKSLNNAKASQEYLPRAYLQDHFIPSLSFVGSYGKNLSQKFKNDFPAQFTRNPKNDWSVSVVASLPL